MCFIFLFLINRNELSLRKSSNYWIQSSLFIIWIMSTTSDLNHFSCKEPFLTGSQHCKGCGIPVADGAVARWALAGRPAGVWESPCPRTPATCRAARSRLRLRTRHWWWERFCTGAIFFGRKYSTVTHVGACGIGTQVLLNVQSVQCTSGGRADRAVNRTKQLLYLL